MPKTKSAKKALRKSQKRRLRNLERKEKIKSKIKEFLALVKEKKPEAKDMLSEIYKLLDKAVKVGLIKKNTAARKKSKLARLLFKITNEK